MESPASGGESPGSPVEQPGQHSTKPFLGRCSGKLIPIGAEHHQVEATPLLTLEQFRLGPDSVVRRLTAHRPTAMFKASRCMHLDLDTYFLFAEQYLEDKEPQIFQQGTHSREQVHRRACELLHRCGYNISKAKFLLVFPYYQSYERMRINKPLHLTDEERQVKIKQHLQGLKENRSKDLQKWVSQIQQSIESRISLNKLNQIIDLARQNKFEVPDTIRDQIDRSMKFGKEIKKWSATKQPLEKLKQRRDSLSDQKIITNDMSNFEEAVTRSEEWIERVTAYEDQHFMPPLNSTLLVRDLRPHTEKIDFRQMHSLVQDYNNLPVLHQAFEVNTKRLHDETSALLERIPQFTKITKTRTSVPTKITLSSIKLLQADIDQHVVTHDEFDNFHEYICESLELMERISMFLEDDRSQRNTKVMQSYLKLLNDVPIASSLPQKLENYIEYYQIIDRIRKDIINPNRFEQTHDLIKEAGEKGFCTPELAEYESKLKVYRGWFESTQILNESQRETRLVDLIREEGTIIGNMIEQSVFRAQLHHARTQLNIDGGIFEEYERRLQQIDLQKQNIRHLLTKEDPEITTLISTLVTCIRDSIKYPQFISLYMRINQVISVLVKVNCLLDLYRYGDARVEMFMKRQEYEELLSTIGSKREIREMTKHAAENLAMEMNERKTFSKNVPEWRLFMSFLQYSREWEDEAGEFLNQYANTGALDDMTLDQLLVRSERVLTDKSVLEHLTEVHQIAKWKGVILQRLSDRSLQVFSQSSRVQMEILQVALSAQQTKLTVGGVTQQQIKKEALAFLFEHRQCIQSLLVTIVKASIERTQKLPELVRTLREIEKLNVRDNQLDQMKHQLAKQIYHCEMWKDRYVALRRLDIRKKERDQQEQQQAPVAEDKEVPVKRRDRHTFRCPQFSYYFKLPVLITEFYYGTKLRVVLEELNKLKVVFEEAYEFMQAYRRLQDVEIPTALELQALQNEGSKLPLFILESWMMRKRSKYVQCWVGMASIVLESVPILKLQELQVGAEELEGQVVMDKKQSMQKQEAQAIKDPVPVEGPQDGATTNSQPQILTTKRVRKQNPHYNNDEITLLTEELFAGSRQKKKRKPAAGEAEQQSAYQRKQKQKLELRNQKMQFEVCMYLKDPVAYCICRMGLMNESSVMVMCENCEAWFHAECIGIRKSYVKNIQKYYCMACCKKLNTTPEYLASFLWTNRSKLTEQQFEALLQEGREMRVKLDQLPKLQILETRITRWKDAVDRIIEQTANKQSVPRQLKKHISELYLESFWLPTRHLETDVLERLFLTQKL